jgi:hypothetical protein
MPMNLLFYISTDEPVGEEFKLNMNIVACNASQGRLCSSGLPPYQSYMSLSGSSIHDGTVAHAQRGAISVSHAAPLSGHQSNINLVNS